MKKFSDISDKNTSLEFKKDKPKTISNDVEKLDDQISNNIDGTKLDGEWEIVNVIDVSSNKPPHIDESLIINAELGGKDVKRGDYVYITALIHRKGSGDYHQNQMGVLKARITDIYNNLFVLNSIKD